MGARPPEAVAKGGAKSRSAPVHAGGTVVLPALLIAAHVTIVASILLQERPVIWPLHNDTIHRSGQAVDFYAVYHAGVNLRNGHDPYDDNPDGVTPRWSPFRYLPIVATGAQALTVLPPHTAYVLWVLVLEALFAVLIATLWTRIDGATVRLLTIAILLLNSTYFLELYMGQFTFASTAFLALCLLVPGAWLLFYLSTLLKPFTLATIPALMRERRLALHAVFALALVVVLSFPYFSAHPQQWREFLRANFALSGGLDTGNYGFVRLLQLLVEDLHVPIDWNFLVTVCRYGTLLATTLVVLRAKRAPVVVSAAALLLAHFLTYQHVWEHHMSGVSVLGAMMLTVPDRRRAVTGVVLASLFLLAVPTPFGLLDTAKDPRVWDPSEHWPRYTLYLLVLAKVAPTAALFLCAIAHLCQSGLMTTGEVLRSVVASRRRR